MDYKRTSAYRIPNRDRGNIHEIFAVDQEIFAVDIGNYRKTRGGKTC